MQGALAEAGIDSRYSPGAAAEAIQWKMHDVKYDLHELADADELDVGKMRDLARRLSGLADAAAEVE